LSWTKELPEPIKLRDGRELRTLSDVRALILRLPETISHNPKWAYATELLLKAAETGKRADVVDAGHQARRPAKADGYMGQRS
jgi:hypothetical protein